MSQAEVPLSDPIRHRIDRLICGGMYGSNGRIVSHHCTVCGAQPKPISQQPFHDDRNYNKLYIVASVLWGGG